PAGAMLHDQFSFGTLCELNYFHSSSDAILNLYRSWPLHVQTNEISAGVPAVEPAAAEDGTRPTLAVEDLGAGQFLECLGRGLGHEQVPLFFHDNELAVGGRQGC